MPPASLFPAQRSRRSLRSASAAVAVNAHDGIGTDEDVKTARLTSDDAAQHQHVEVMGRQQDKPETNQSRTTRSHQRVKVKTEPGLEASHEADPAQAQSDRNHTRMRPHEADEDIKPSLAELEALDCAGARDEGTSGSSGARRVKRDVEEVSTAAAGSAQANPSRTGFREAAVGVAVKQEQGRQQGATGQEQGKLHDESNGEDDDNDSLFGEEADESSSAGNPVNVVKHENKPAGVAAIRSGMTFEPHEAKPRIEAMPLHGTSSRAAAAVAAQRLAGSAALSGISSGSGQGNSSSDQWQEEQEGLFSGTAANSSAATLAHPSVRPWPARAAHGNGMAMANTVDVDLLEYPEYDDQGRVVPVAAPQVAMTITSTEETTPEEADDREGLRGEPTGARTLLDVCRGVMMRLAPRYDDIGDLSYAQHPLFFDTRPVDQLGELERNSPNLRDETDALWRKFVAAKDGLLEERVKNGHEEPPKSWRKLYKRLVRIELERKAQAVEEMKQLYASELAARQERATRKTSDLLPIRRRGSGAAINSGVKPTLLGKMRAQAVTERRDRAAAVAENRRRSAPTSPTVANHSLGTRKPPAGLGMAPKRLGPTGTARRRAASKSAPAAKTSFTIRSTIRPPPDVAAVVEASSPMRSTDPIDVDDHVPRAVIDLEAAPETTESAGFTFNLFQSPASPATTRPAVKIKKRLVHTDAPRAVRSDSEEMLCSPQHTQMAASPSTSIKRRISSGPTLFMPRKRPKVS